MVIHVCHTCKIKKDYKNSSSVHKKFERNEAMEFSIVQFVTFFTLALGVLMISTEASKANPPSLSRGTTDGLVYANFVPHEFHYLNITILGAASFYEGSDCGFACVNTLPCFSFNLAAFPDINGRLLCELLPSDKYNNSDKFVASQIFHHYSIWSECSSGPCQNNGTCVSKYEQNTYTCVCPAGYTGNNCETADECIHYMVLDESDRNRNYHYDPVRKCDNASLTEGWHRFQGGAGTKMADTKLDTHYCNTDLTGFLNGTHPKIEDGVVSMKVCFHGYSNYCHRNINIRVRNCGAYFVYHLKKVPLCYARYCGSD